MFESNAATTWTTVDIAISDYLSLLWAEGALYGATASQAFNVSVGLGSTMTALDILNGQMVVSVQVHLTATGNPVSLQFTQTMGT